jgi:hypothetical protein
MRKSASGFLFTLAVVRIREFLREEIGGLGWYPIRWHL